MNEFDRPYTGRSTKRGGAGRFFLFLIVLLVALLATNPGKEDFVDYAIKNISEESGGKLGAGIANMIGKPVLNSVTERENYILFSIFKLPVLDGSNNYLGIFKLIFIKL
ncbi:MULTISPECIES: hypothetical protein [unclassified Paenibacillus]|uniref:hypothetical protein n=1 Tax=unclassified Paenibacillus TaxID=185978 RepID=UPI00367A6927